MKYYNDNPTETERCMFQSAGLYRMIYTDILCVYAVFRNDNCKWTDCVDSESYAGNSLVHSVAFNLVDNSVILSGVFDKNTIGLIADRMNELGFK